MKAEKIRYKMGFAIKLLKSGTFLYWGGGCSSPIRILFLKDIYDWFNVGITTDIAYRYQSATIISHDVNK